jgi:hypothetical protein
MTIYVQNKTVPSVRIDKLSNRKPILGNVHEKRFENLDHLSPVLSKNKRVASYVSIAKS